MTTIASPAPDPVPPLLVIEGLESHFESGGTTVRAVDGVSLAVQNGRRLGVVGESGSGKTQTFFGTFGLADGSPGVVAGRARLGDIDLLPALERFVTRETHGTRTFVRKQTARWARHHRDALAPVLGRDVAILFQDPKRSLIPYWTVGQHMADVLRRRTGSEPQAGEACALLEELGFREPERIRQSYPEQLSGGEAQRALLAVTLAMRPRLLVADEPTTGLDTINQARVLDTLTQLQERHRLALVLISHDLAVVDAMVDDVVVLFAGRVMERMSATALRGAPDEALHPYTRELRESQRRRARGVPIAQTVHAQPMARASSGCAYQHRCALKPLLAVARQSRCAKEAPHEYQISHDHALACWGLGL